MDSFPEIFYAIFTGKWPNRVSAEKGLFTGLSEIPVILLEVYRAEMFFHICNQVDKMKNQILQETYSLYTV